MADLCPLADQGAFPTADLIARALVLGAIDLCELSVLVKYPDRALAGLIAFRGRWVAFEAVCAMHLRADPRRIGRLIGCGSDPVGMMLQVRQQSWWRDSRTTAMVAALASGAPLQPIFDTRTAYGLMIAIRERIEERLA